ncbi:hypothetical protein HDU76_008755, partial [Blyttiomyces sp. JEL0837]
MSSSPWNLLPTEIKDQIFSEADVPTRFINHYPASESEINAKAHDIWIAVITTSSWDLDLSRLPNNKFPTILNGLEQVTSREVYHSLCKARPDLDGIQHLQRIFNEGDFWTGLKPDLSGEWDPSFLHIHESEIPKLFINIPMRQYWMDELNGFDDLDQLKLLFMAGCCGHFKLFQHLFDDIFNDKHQQSLRTSTSTSEITISEVFSLIMFFAAKRGYQDIIDFVLSNVSINKNNTEDQQQPQQDDSLTLDPTITTLSIYETLKHGHLQLFRILSALPNKDPTLQDCDAFLDDAVNHLHIIKFLFMEFDCLQDLEYQPNQALWYASKNGSFETVKFLLSAFPTLNPSSYKIEDSIEIASTNGHIQIVSLLLKYSKSDRFNINITRAVRNAVDNGDLAMVRMLLNASGFTIWGDQAVRIAAGEGHLDIVKLLVSNPRVDLAVSDLYESVKIALEFGHDEIAKFLMLDPRLQELLTNGVILSDASMVGNVGVVKLALGMSEYSRNDIHRYLLLAIEYGRLEIVKLLVEVPGVAPARKNEALKMAVKGGHVDVVRLLLEVTGFDVTDNDNEVLITAGENGHFEVLHFLLDSAKEGVDNEFVKLLKMAGPMEFINMFRQYDLKKFSMDLNYDN